MSQRITQRDLDAVIKRLNNLTHSPLEPYSKSITGKFTANIGCYHLDQAYGGNKLVRMQNASGGISDVLSTGFVSKRELYNHIQSFIRGIEAKK